MSEFVPLAKAACVSFTELENNSTIPFEQNTGIYFNNPTKADVTFDYASNKSDTSFTPSSITVTAGDSGTSFVNIKHTQEWTGVKLSTQYQGNDFDYREDITVSNAQYLGASQTTAAVVGRVVVKAISGLPLGAVAETHLIVRRPHPAGTYFIETVLSQPRTQLYFKPDGTSERFEVHIEPGLANLAKCDFIRTYFFSAPPERKLLTIVSGKFTP